MKNSVWMIAMLIGCATAGVAVTDDTAAKGTPA